MCWTDNKLIFFTFVIWSSAINTANKGQKILASVVCTNQNVTMVTLTDRPFYTTLDVQRGHPITKCFFIQSNFQFDIGT